MTSINRRIVQRRMSQLVYVPLVALSFFLLVYSCIELITRWSDGGNPNYNACEVALALPKFWLAALALYGIVRATNANFVMAKEYRHWLKTTPWNVALPLPIVPLQLVWQDALLFAMLELYTHFGLGLPVLTSTGAVLFGYLSAQIFSFAQRKESQIAATLLAYGFPALLLVYPDLRAMSACLMALYPLAWWGIHAQMRAFPWDEEPKFDAEQLTYTGPWRPERNQDLRAFGIIVSVFVGWLMFCIIKNIGEADTQVVHEFINPLYVALALACIGLSRLPMYIAEYRPPLSLLGRLRTGRLIIPRYDVVFAGPLLLVVLAPLPRAMMALHWSFALTMSIMVTLAMLGAWYLPPSVRWWKLCGAHRIRPLKQRTMPLNRLGNVLELVRPSRLFLVPWVAVLCIPLLALGDDQKLSDAILLSITVAGIHAAYRVLSTLPDVFKGYSAWLQTTPWTAAQRLPLGTPRLCWQDFLVVALIEAVELYRDPRFPSGIVLAAFLGVHVALTSAVLMKCQRPYTAVLKMGLPLVLTFAPGLVGRLAGLIVLAMVAQIAWQRWLTFDLPNDLNTPKASEPSPGIFSLGYHKQQERIWPEAYITFLLWINLPFHMLAARFGAANVEELYSQAEFLIRMIICMVPLLGFMTYRRGYGTPLNLMWRLRNGLIIPDYDRIFVPPLLMLLLIVAGPIVFRHAGFDHGPAMLLTLLFVLLVNRFAWPPYDQWQLTGFHHVNLAAASGDVIRKRK